VGGPLTDGDEVGLLVFLLLHGRGQASGKVHDPSVARLAVLLERLQRLLVDLIDRKHILEARLNVLADELLSLPH
jgi:hypothetical protein